MKQSIVVVSGIPSDVKQDLNRVMAQVAEKRARVTQISSAITTSDSRGDRVAVIVLIEEG